MANLLNIAGIEGKTYFERCISLYVDSSPASPIAVQRHWKSLACKKYSIPTASMNRHLRVGKLGTFPSIVSVVTTHQLGNRVRILQEASNQKLSVGGARTLLVNFAEERKGGGSEKINSIPSGVAHSMPLSDLNTAALAQSVLDLSEKYDRMIYLMEASFKRQDRVISIMEKSSTIGNMQAQSLQNVFVMLTDLNQKFDDIARTATMLSPGQKAVIIPKLEEPGISATSLAAKLMEENVGHVFTMDDVRNIAVNLGLLGDPKFSVWAKRGDNAVGEVYGGYWRILPAGVEQVKEFIKLYLWESQERAERGEPNSKKLVMSKILSITVRVGNGQATQLSDDRPAPVTSGNPFNTGTGAETNGVSHKPASRFQKRPETTSSRD